MKRVLVTFVVALVWGISSACGLASAQEGKPWALRDFYTLKFGATAFTYDVNTSEWQIEVDGAGFLFQNVQSEIVLGDGTTLRLAGQKMDHDEREPFDDLYGKGTTYRSVYAPGSGLAMRYSILQYSNRAFILLQLDVRNESDAPIEIAAIRPAVMTPGSISALAQGARFEPLYVGQRGGMPHLDDTGDPMLLQFALDSPAVSLGIGMLPSGTSEPSIAFNRSTEHWTASAGVAYSPPIVLAPGDSVRADPVWIGISDRAPAYIRDVYSWCRTVAPSARRALETPPSWVTMASTDSIDRLYDAARSWRQYNIRNALIPGAWEQQPGSHRPKVPQYPADLRQVVKTLDDVGIAAGLSCDPLAAGQAKSASAVTAEDGSRWFLPTNQEDANDAADHARGLTDMGFSFYVIEPSSIPDDVLRQAKLTRSEADLIAFRVMLQAAGDAPVIPSSAMSLVDELPRWQLAASATAAYPDIGIVPGPIRLDAARITKVTPALLKAFDDFFGPIEILGVPDSKIQRAMGPTLGDPEWRRRLDAYRNPNLRVDTED